MLLPGNAFTCKCIFLLEEDILNLIKYVNDSYFILVRLQFYFI